MNSWAKHHKATNNTSQSKEPTLNEENSPPSKEPTLNEENSPPSKELTRYEEESMYKESSPNYPRKFALVGRSPAVSPVAKEKRNYKESINNESLSPDRSSFSPGR